MDNNGNIKSYSMNIRHVVLFWHVDKNTTRINYITNMIAALCLFLRVKNTFTDLGDNFRNKCF